MLDPTELTGGAGSPMDFLAEMTVVIRPIESLKAFGPQTKKHPEAQIKALMTSITAFKLNRPIIVDEDGARLGGDAIWEAARRLGMTEIATVTISHLTRKQKLAFKVADNRLAEKGEWNKEGLRAVFTEILELDTEFDMDVIGFSSQEREVILFGDEAEAADDDELIDPPEAPTSQIGDLFALGPHRVLCGDATLTASYEQLMGGVTARVVIADSPWNVPVQGHVTSQKKHGEFVQASGEMSDAEYEGFTRSWKREAAAVCVDGALFYSFIDWRGAFILQSAAKDVGLELKNQIIWNKLAGGMGSMYRSQYEVVLLFKVGTAPHINNVELGKHGRNRSNVWDCRGYNGFRSGGRDALDIHPSPKPVALTSGALLDCTKRGDVVLDPFSGSGSTLIAAEKIGRKARVMDLDPRYVDATLLRWERYAGKEAVHVETGLTFRELRHQRSRAKSQPPVRIRTRMAMT